MNMKSLSDSDVRSALSQVDLKAALRDAIGGLADGTSKQPNKTIVELEGDKGDCMFFTGAVENLGCFGVKASPYLTAKIEKGENPVTAFTMLVSSDTGLPLVLCDATYLTVARTAETTGLAVDILLRDGEGQKLAVIGSGQAAMAHIEVQLRDREWSSISIFSPNILNDEERKQKLESMGKGNIRIATSAEDAVADADLVMLCTNANSAVVEFGAIKSGALITSISTDAANAHEIDPQSLNLVDVYCDYRETVALKAGEMKIAEDEYDWAYDAIIADLPELILSGDKVDASRTRYWRSTGLAVEDIAAAYAVANVG